MNRFYKFLLVLHGGLAFVSATLFLLSCYLDKPGGGLLLAAIFNTTAMAMVLAAPKYVTHEERA